MTYPEQNETSGGAPDEAADESVDVMAQRRAEVFETVGRLIARAWTDDEFKRDLIADPQPHLRAAGLHFPERYRIEFYDDPLADLGDWSSVGRGPSAIHRFPIPPPPAAGDLAQDLVGPDGASVACCSPCACCTGAVAHVE